MSRREKLFYFLLAIAFAVLVFLPARAGDVNLTWDASEGATGYRVYVGSSTGSYSPAPAADVSDTAAALTGLADGCVQLYTAVTAYNAIGESGFSDELVFFPRPMVVNVAEGATPQQLSIMGGNFSPACTLTINNAAVPFTRDSCELITLPVLSIPEGSSWGTMQICNGAVCVAYILKPAGVPGNLQGS